MGAMKANPGSELKHFIRIVSHLNWQHLLLIGLSLQYIGLQLATRVQYYDAPRNLHWGLYLIEQPRYLIGTVDVYDHVLGFLPSPESLAPMGFATNQPPGMHPWWGPLYLLMIAVLWKLTRSYLIIQMVVPLASGGLIWLTYAFGKRYFDWKVGLLAASLLAIFPIFHENAVMAFFEPVSALLLLCTFWAYLSRRTLITTLLGSLLVLTKIDMIFLYFGTVVGMNALSLFFPQLRLPKRHVRFSLIVPAILCLVWCYLRYVVGSSYSALDGVLNLAIFKYLLGQTIPQFFGMGNVISVPVLVILGCMVGVAVWRMRQAEEPVVWLLTVSFILDLVVLIVYLTLPVASNNPRIIIPTLPFLCIMVAIGLYRSHPRVREFFLSTIVVVFILGSFSGTLYQIIQGRLQDGRMAVWETLSREEPGVVMTEFPLECILYSRQPATWFFEDAEFQKNILYDLDNFQKYVTDNQVRYVVLPRSEIQYNQKYQVDPLIQFYSRLPFGRQVYWYTDPLVSSEVRQHLSSFPQQIEGDYIVYDLKP
jgi:hypothetical protein